VADSRTVSAIGPASRALASLLRGWRERAESTPSSSSDATAFPALGSVTARTPAEAAAPRDLPLLIVLIGTLAAAASFTLGFDFWLGLDVFAAALIGVIAMRWPAMFSREPSSPKAGVREPERRAA